MNADNNHLVSDYENINLESRLLYTPIPERLTRAAKIKLAGKSETYVSKTSGGALSKWAAKVRKNNKIDL